ncbi:acetyl-CoA C-acetyltransferase [Branchiibius hedensis]|uniref:acetyl-CoA C-acyltransferase n=1 Tax=Branchiibius hedensis TaxID=672460 RepID=A0A2Y9C2C6_9MICO|nr:acetyl-CoA C-acetyltransferase [Branchiibius hedensis]PWJ27052.1 acetyl-CoA C-acetyltransferase [Branchiibius hedensis]SSA35863.1 acetyl-CoA C-acetyltransferase [Branchiibius hedensis]
MVEAVIVAAARSPIGRAGKGSLVDVRPLDLLGQMIEAALAQVPQLSRTQIDDTYVGTAQPAGEQGYNLGRQASIFAGADAVPGATVSRYCASSVQTTRMAFHAIKAGEGSIFLSAGVESVSRYRLGRSDGMPDTHHPRYADAEARSARRAGAGVPEWTDPRDEGHLPDPYLAMGQTAENVAGLRSVSRAAQDEFGVRSQNLAEKAIDSGFYQADITPVTLADGTVVSTDDGPRRSVTMEKVSALAPVFRPDGTVTAGNCCPLNDGAAALIVMSDVRARELGITPLARVVATGVSALSPEIMGLGPVDASRQALAYAGMSASDIDLWEINEAFAAQVLPTVEDLGLDLERVNVHGGAIALGHPFGMTGARMTRTLLTGLTARDASTGVVTMCAAGGQGMALIVERLS